MIESLVILLALAAGMAFRAIGYPPLLGYLIAGFAAGALGIGDVESLSTISAAGVTLLLFTIGLKLNVRELIQPQVWVAGGAQIVLIMPTFVGVIWCFGKWVPGVEPMSATAMWAVAFALSFSSTVFAVKIFDERGEGASHHARITIGILVLQDLLAVIFLSVKAGMAPHWWALGLLALPLIRPLLIKVIDLCGHSELLGLCGIAFAFGASELFYACNVKGDLGALIVGAIIAGCPKSNELYKNLIGFKDLFLVAFFVSVGYAGLPPISMALLAVVLVLLISLRSAIYFCFFTWLKTRARTATLATFGLASFSEFGLIVAALASESGWLNEDWVTTIALAVAMSFFISVPFNSRIHELYAKWYRFLMRFESGINREKFDLQGYDVLVMGLGRVGSGAYEYLKDHSENKVMGVESELSKLPKLIASGINAVHGDATDYEFWDQIELNQVKLICVSLSNHKENIEVVKMIRRQNYQGKIAVIARFPDEQRELIEEGCIAFNLYAEAGHGFAEHVIEALPGVLVKG